MTNCTGTQTSKIIALDCSQIFRELFGCHDTSTIQHNDELHT